MKLARLLRLRSYLSSSKLAEEQRLKDLFGDTQVVEGAAVDIGHNLMQKQREIIA